MRGLLWALPHMARPAPSRLMRGLLWALPHMAQAQLEQLKAECAAELEPLDREIADFEAGLQASAARESTRPTGRFRTYSQSDFETAGSGAAVGYCSGCP
eukprot:6163448-Prymnesium_polylepis.1